jgi:predicted MPP superfamily phosphohydrolase
MALRRGTKRLLLATIVLLSALLLAALWRGIVAEPDSLVVRSYSLDLPGWPRALDGFKIAALGDIHAGSPYIDKAKLEEVVRRVSAEKVDLIVWLGDYVIQGVVGGNFMEPEEIALILGKAQATNGQVAIIGNQDRWLGTERIERAFAQSGITFLRSQSKILSLGGERLHVYGLDDFELSPDYWPTFNRIRRQWSRLPQNEPVLVLSHSPDIFPEIPSRVSLTLAAHTHGGQVRLPVIGSPVVPSFFGQRFARGHIIERGRHLFVNTGLGTSIIPIRLGVPPEISILTLHAAGGN